MERTYREYFTICTADSRVFPFGVFVQSFFTAGAIGMAKKASETGDTVLSDMIASGSKNIFRLFLTVLLIGLLMLGGIVFIVPGALDNRGSECS